MSMQGNSDGTWGSHGSMNLELPCIYCGSSWGYEQLIHYKWVLSLPGGSLLERLYPWKEITVVISRSAVQETTRTAWTLCRWELLVGLSELPRAGRTHRESPHPRIKQEGVEMAPKSLERRFKVWSEQQAEQCPSGAHPRKLSLSCRELQNLLVSPCLIFIYSFIWGYCGPQNGNKSTSSIWVSSRVKTNHDVAAQP